MIPENKSSFLVAKGTFKRLKLMLQQWENLIVTGGQLLKAERNARLKIDISTLAGSVASSRVLRGSVPGDTSYSGIKAALEGLYSSASVTPIGGDTLELHDSGAVTHVYLVTPDNDVTQTPIPGQSGASNDRVKLAVGDVTRTAYRVDAGGSATSGSPVLVDLTISAGELFPTAADLKSTIEDAYSSASPVVGDEVLIRHEGRIVFTYTIWSSLGFSDVGRYAFTFSVGGTSWGAVGKSTGTFSPELSP